MSHRITDSQRILLRRMIFHETFSELLGETGLHAGVVRDDLLTLLHKGYVEVFLDGDFSEPVRQMAYDSDHLNLYLFRASHAGLRQIQNR
jgi:hypothetical protein